MKKGIHPQLNEVKIVLTTGEEVVMKSTMTRDIMKLDVDPNNHPAWTGKRNMERKSGQAEKFKSRFGTFAG